MKYITPKKLSVAIVLLIIIVCACSCSVTKKSQHSIKEADSSSESHKKDSGVISTTEVKNGTSEQETNKKVVEIEFPEQPDTPAKAEDYFEIENMDSLFGKLKPSVTKVKTNRRAAVTLKNNGDIVLNQVPKSIRITDNQDKQKIDTGSSKTSNSSQVATEDKKDTAKQKTETENNTKRSKAFNLWWLLALLLIPGYLVYKKYIK